MTKRDYLLRRGIAFGLDMMIIELIAVVLWGVTLFLTISPETPVEQNVVYIVAVLYLWQFVLLCLKDAFGISLGKRVNRMQIVPVDPEKEDVRFWQKVVRNITLLFWPIEALCVIMTGTRLADKWLGLKVICEL